MSHKRKVLLTGAGGQLGQAIVQLAPDSLEIVACDRATLDIADAAQVEACISAHQPDVVINAAAYTAVDQAESESDRARAINTDGARNIAASSHRHGAWPIQISTDFVFDGQRSTPYPTDAPTNPLGVYGLTKRDGEIAAREASEGQATILRTAWVYGPVGKNFMLTMQRLIAERDVVRVVCDQVGTPTSTHSIARALFALLGNDIGRGETLHWTDAGVASWYDFACAIRMVLKNNSGEGTALASIEPISSSEYPTPAGRPAFSVLNRHSDLLLQMQSMGWESWWQDCVLRQQF